MRGAEVRELIQQIAVRPDLICHVLVRVHRKENVGNVIGERSAIVRKGYRTARIIGEDVWQQRICDGFGILRRVSARVLQFVREHADEATIICRVSAEVFRSLLAGKEDRLQGSSTAVRLDPAIGALVRCASPNSYCIVSQSRVGQFKHDAANIFICEEVIPCELHVIEIAVYVEKERIAAPTKEKAVVPRFSHQGFARDRDWCSFNNNLAILAGARGLRALNTEHCRSLLPIFRSCELNAVTNIGDSVPVCVDLDLVKCSWRKGLRSRRLWRVQPERRVHIEDNYCLGG